MAVAEIQSEERFSLARKIGAQVRALRKLKGFTLKEMAMKMGTTPQTLQRLEKGVMALTVDWVELMADALGVEPAVFFESRSKYAAAHCEAIEQAYDTFSQAIEDARVNLQAEIAGRLVLLGRKG